LAEIASAPTSSDARALYETAIDKLIDTSLMQNKINDYFAQILYGAGSYEGLSENQRKAVNLGTYVFLTGRPISEFLLAQYQVDDEGLQEPQTFTNGPNEEFQAGYITTRGYSEFYMDQQRFDMAREIMSINFADEAPFPRTELNRWSESTLMNTYRFDPGAPDMVCPSCHSALNIIRRAFADYNNSGNNFNNSGRNRGNNQYGMEENIGNINVEPRDESDTPIPVEEADLLYVITPNGNPVLNPRALAQEVVAHPDFAKGWTERLLSILLDLPYGSPGTTTDVPNHFADSDAQIEFLTNWTTQFNELDQTPKEFFRTFLKSSNFLVLVYQED
jgi:hypothetical protein